MFFVIDLANIDERSRPVVNRAFELWSKTYSEILSEASEELRSDYFFRSKLLLAICDSETIQALCLCNVHDAATKGVLDQSYFDIVPSDIKEQFKRVGHTILSIEWVTVCPELRARFSRIQYADVMMGLAFETCQDTHCTSVLGFSRYDLKADKVAEKFGVRNLGTVRRHSIDCGVMFSEKETLTLHGYQKTRELIEYLYSTKTNFASWVINKARRVA